MSKQAVDLTDTQRQALNAHGLWHGTPYPFEAGVRSSQFQGGVPAHGGLYVTCDYSEAQWYARQHIKRDELSLTFKPGFPGHPERGARVYRITLLPGSSVLLEEDEFDWAWIHDVVAGSLTLQVAGDWLANVLATKHPDFYDAVHLELAQLSRGLHERRVEWDDAAQAISDIASRVTPLVLEHIVATGHCGGVRFRVFGPFDYELVEATLDSDLSGPRTAGSRTVMGKQKQIARIAAKYGTAYTDASWLYVQRGFNRLSVEDRKQRAGEALQYTEWIAKEMTALGRPGDWPSIVDFFFAPTRGRIPHLMSRTYDEVLALSEAWHRRMFGGAEGATREPLEDRSEFITYPNGWAWVTVSPEECAGEGASMGHCVGDYSEQVAEGELAILSLRGPDNVPHITVEVEIVSTEEMDPTGGLLEPYSGVITQIKGVGNQKPSPKYEGYIADLIEYWAGVVETSDWSPGPSTVARWGSSPTQLRHLAIGHLLITKGLRHELWRKLYKAQPRLAHMIAGRDDVEPSLMKTIIADALAAIEEGGFYEADALTVLERALSNPAVRSTDYPSLLRDLSRLKPAEGSPFFLDWIADWKRLMKAARRAPVVGSSRLLGARDHRRPALAQYWHGGFRGGLQIAETGLLLPGNTGTDAPEWTPLPNRVYLTPDLNYAIIYALGGVFAGARRTEGHDERIRREGRYGYVWRVADLSLANVIPDEDHVGKALGQVLDGTRAAQWWLTELAEAAGLDDIPSTDAEMGPEGWSVMEGVEDGLYSDYIAAGKAMLPLMSQEDVARFLAEFPESSIAHLGPVPVSEGWRLDRLRYPDIAEDGSNFFEIAEKITAGQPSTGGPGMAVGALNPHPRGHASPWYGTGVPSRMGRVSPTMGRVSSGMGRVSHDPCPRAVGGAPGYQSWQWVQQDWRSVVLTKDGVDYSKKCGAPGTRLPDGSPRLCLPKYVIQQLLKTKEGTAILREQARKKQRAAEGERVPWHPRIRELHREVEERTEADDPQKG